MNRRETVENELLKGIKRFNERLECLRGKSKKLSLIRLAVFFLALVLFFYFFFSGQNIPVYITIFSFIVIFGILTGIQNKIERGIKKNILWLDIKKMHVSRMNLRWDELPRSLYSPDEKHPFDFDLSITGEYSLHRLLNTASSFEGSKLLKEWLTSYDINRSDIIDRQALVKELMDKPGFRDKLSLFSMLISNKQLKGTKILEWISTSSELSKIKKIFFSLLAIIPVNIILFVLYLLNIIPAWFVFVTLLYAAVYWFNTKYFSGLFEELLIIEDEFGKFTVIFDFLEKYPYKDKTRLKEIASVYLNHAPSADFKKIRRIASSISVTRNPLAALILNILFPYNLYFALKLEKLRLSIAEDMPLWLNTWYRIEACNSLANFAYLNPQCTFPDIISEGQLVYDTQNISHPLIHFRENIANDFRILSKGEVHVITGSNMSGKSTFLKTLGINLAMAFAGGAVNAEKFSTSVFRINCCIKVSDSVIDGISYFYAEVKRLKKILIELNKNSGTPVFFLIDEIFKGTNNIERLKGSRAYIKEVVKLNGAGLVSTHDLELSRLEEEISSVSNFHFREEAVDGRMIFDYKLHPGPSPTTNALKIMKSEGLPVE